MAKKNETMETPASSPTAGAKTKNSANALAAKLKTRRAAHGCGRGCVRWYGRRPHRWGEHGHDVRLRLGHVLDVVPLGALGTMIATKTMIPRAVVSLLLIAALVLVFGRAFCSWLCPTMLIDRIRDFFRSPKKRRS